MNYLYITLNRAASQYAISLDEIFLTLYGFGKKRKFALPGKTMIRKSYRPTETFSLKDTYGVVYRIGVTAEQHDTVRDIMCDFLMDSRRYRMSLHKNRESFSSAEFIIYILEEAEIISFADSPNGIAEEDLTRLMNFDEVDIIYEGDLKQYVAEKKKKSESSDIRYMQTVKQNKNKSESDIAGYEYVPGRV